jgi:hypothetical protein
VDHFSFETNEDELCKQIQSELVVTQQFGNALRRFEYANLEGGLKLSDLVERWAQETQDRENVSNA